MTPTIEVMDFVGQDYSLKREKRCIAETKRQGLEVIDGDDHTLLFDLDSEEDYKVFMSRVHFLEVKFFMRHLVVSRSKSGNYHAVVTLDPHFPPVDAVLRIAIQACMGSDWKKEMLGVLRTFNYQSSDSKLFRPQPLDIVYEWISPNSPL